MAAKKSSAPTSITALKALFQRAGGEYASRKQRAESSVVRWAWATGRLFSLAPFQAARGLGPEPLPLRSAPAKKGGRFEFGFDAEDRLVVVREHQQKRGCAYETFHEWDDAGATAVRYDYDPKYKVPSNAARLFVADGRPTKYLLVSHRGTVSETYEYRGERLVRIRVAPSREPARVCRITYDAEGHATLDER